MGRLNPRAELERVVPIDTSAYDTKWKVRVEEVRRCSMLPPARFTHSGSVQRPVAMRWLAICSVCNKNDDEPGALAYCRDCGLAAHLQCRGASVRPELVDALAYLCARCAFCSFCHRKDNVDLVRTCNVCLKTAHAFCLQLGVDETVRLASRPGRDFRCKRTLSRAVRFCAIG